MRCFSHITFRTPLILFSSALWVMAACSSPTPTPTQPSPDPLAVSCPADATLEATGPDGAIATLDPPAVTGGRPPYRIECEPTGEAAFPVGDTTVTCAVTDVDQEQASCGFTVSVRISRTLSRTKFVAFGDSITEGKLSPTPFRLIIEPLEAYPAKLERLLQDRFPTQSIAVLNRGVGGEKVDEGAKRLPGVLEADKPEVVLVLEGINNIRGIPTRTAADYLEKMIKTAKKQNVEMIIATLMPVSDAREASHKGLMDAIRKLNDQIVLLAAEHGLGDPVDLFGLFEADPGLLGMDGLHPTREGYTKMAEMFAAAIRERYESAAPAARFQADTPLRQQTPAGYNSRTR
jgi:lysophospholipase L1-like esterase